MGQVNSESLVSPSIPSHTRAVAKRANCLKDNCPEKQYVSPVRMPKHECKVNIDPDNLNRLDKVRFD